MSRVYNTAPSEFFTTLEEVGQMRTYAKVSVVNPSRPEATFTPTEPNDLFGPTIKEVVSTVAEESPDKTIKAMTGVIDTSDGDKVVLKLENDVLIGFSRSLFPDSSLVKLGQPIVYKIMERPSGHRYQAFSEGIDRRENIYSAEILSTLAGIKYK